MSNARLYWLHALSSLHVGAGRGVGYIDLPIMREKVTNWPLVPGSAVKGVLRDHYANTPHVNPAFGKSGDENANSGSLVFSDARIACLPVRSLYGTFAWCTSPGVLRRLSRDLAAAGLTGAPQPAALSPAEERTWMPQGTQLKAPNGKVYLEDLDLTAVEREEAKGWANWFSRHLGLDETWKAAFLARFAIVPDNVFDFLSETGTEVVARVRIEDDKKTVASGALWYEESLPAETILGGLVWCDRIYGGNGLKPEQLLSEYCKNVHLQMGGKATVGHGRVHCIFANGGN